MQIQTLTLQNFKAHRDRHIEFSPGTNAICGENGAGKTSILEAIAWVLFEYSDYSKQELIRAGASSAQATVEFISNQDGRCYRVQRCTSRGYTLHDPQLNTNLPMRKLEDVHPWLCNHLGVPRNTELGRLFAETIGIPQGTFTADFLKRPGDRKKVFDPILKVEDYKQTYLLTRDLETHAEMQVQELEIAQTHYQQQLADWLSLQQQAQQLDHDLVQTQTQISALAATLVKQETEFSQWQQQADSIATLSQRLVTRTTQIASKTEHQAYLQQTLSEAETAAQVCQAEAPQFQAYQTTQATLQTLETQRQQRQELLQRRDRAQTALNQSQLDQSKLTATLERLDQVRQTIATLIPLVPQQEQLEQEIQTTQAEVVRLQTLAKQQLTLEPQCQQLEQRCTTLNQELTQIPELEAAIAPLSDLESERQHLQYQLTHWEASQGFLERLQPIFQDANRDREAHRTHVQAALQHLEGLEEEPWLSISETLKQGAILNTNLLKSIHQVLGDLTLAASPERLNQQLQEITQQLKQLQQQQQTLNALNAKRQLQRELSQTLDEQKTQLSLIADQLTTLPDQKQQLQTRQATLAQLQNPKQTIQTLQQELKTQASLAQQAETHQQTIEKAIAALQSLELALQEFANLDVDWQQAQTQLQDLQPSYQRYLQHQQRSEQVPTLQADVTALLAEIDALQSLQNQDQAQLQQQQANFDAEAYRQAQQSLEQSRLQLNQLQGSLAPKQAQRQTLEQELQKRQAIAHQRDREQQILTDKQQTLRFITEARRVYNQSGPRISQLYLHEITWEADRLLRELLNRGDIALDWTEDYEIRVQEAGHWRTFKSLSGGEQMCAALAIRLALLKVIADVNIAFFDEPTTNMDQIRRQQLADAIGNLKSFQQLFVISHDDTFERITDNIIRVTRDEDKIT
jgi:exonuclease SbcC